MKSINVPVINNKIQNRPSFGNLAAQSLAFLSASPSIGACAVDLGAMVIPRTAVDMQRGFDAGSETALREGSGMINHALIGVVGAGAATASSQIFNKKYGVKAHSVFADNNFIDILGQWWHNDLKNPEIKNLPANEFRKNFVNRILDNLEGYNPHNSNAKDGWVKINDNSLKIIKDKFGELIDNKEIGYKIPKDAKSFIKNVVTSQTGAESSFRLVNDGIVSHGSLDNMLNNTLGLSKIFSQDKVKKIFQTSKNYADNSFVKGLKSLKTSSALLGLAVSAVIGMSAQPLNAWYTKKRTGKNGFVGVKDNEEKKPYKAKKYLAAGAMAALTLISIGGKSAPEMLNKLQFKSMVPNLNQLKLVYGLTIISRLLSSRDSNEVRESSTKDFLGFTNWLILGDVVSKVVARGLDKNLINEQGKGFVGKFIKSSVKTHNEILLEDMAKAGLKTVDNAKGLPFKEMLKNLPDTMKHTKIKIRNKNISQMAGYLYSGLVLGFGIPKLNIYITKKLNENKKKKEEPVKMLFRPKQPVSETFKSFLKADSSMA